MKKWHRSTMVLACLLSCAVSAMADPFTDALNKLHALYVADASVVSVVMFVAMIVGAIMAPHGRKWVAVVAGGVLLFLFNAAGQALGYLLPVAS